MTIVLEPTLLVIDMQNEYGAARNPETISAVQREIVSAKSRNSAIVVVRTTGYLWYRGVRDRPLGDVIAEISDLVIDYHHAVTINKVNPCGADEIANACKEYGFPTSEFIVCGVNTNRCVKETVMKLLSLFPNCKIHVPEDACNDQHCCSATEVFNNVDRVAVTR